MRFQSAFIAIVVLATSMSVANDNLDESAAIEKVKLLDGNVTRDDSLPCNPVVRISFRRKMRIQNDRFNDKYLHVLKSFPNLTTLDLANTRTTNEGLKVLCDFKNLKTLCLSGTSVTDVGVKELIRLENVTVLNLSETRITDDSLNEIRKLKNLLRLDLRQTKTTEASVRKLKDSLPNTTILFNDGANNMIGGFANLN